MSEPRWIAHRGRRRLALLVAVVLAVQVASLSLAADGDSLTGRWHFDVVSPNGKGTRDLRLVDVEGVLSGAIASSTASRGQGKGAARWLLVQQARERTDCGAQSLHTAAPPHLQRLPRRLPGALRIGRAS